MHTELGFSLGARRSHERQIASLQTRDPDIDQLGRAQHRLGLPSQRRHVNLDRALDQPDIGRHPLSLRHDDDVAGHELRPRRQ
jgi:hypothetical protein